MGLAERFELAGIQTIRPATANQWSVLPTLADVLRLPVLAEALPDVLAGADRLDVPVRWVHVSESLGGAKLLSGGELLLSTGVGWSTDAAGLTAYVGDLVDVGAAGLILELGPRVPEVPAELVAACREFGFPLVVLHREIRFVAVTEAVHGRIISEQTAALQARDEMRELFTGLSLRGSPADFIVRQLSQALNAPVILENLNHEVIAVEGEGVDAAALLGNWSQRSRAARGSTDEGSREWCVVPVEARGMRWGFLVALPGNPHPAGREAVLEQGAIALALGRLADQGADEWLRLSHQNTLDTLLSGRYSSTDGATARLEAAGLPVAGRALVGIVLANRRTAMPTDVAAAAARVGGVALAGTLMPTAPGSTTGRSAAAQIAVLLSLPEGSTFGQLQARRFVNEFAGAAGLEVQDLSVGVGSASAQVSGLLGSLQEALELVGPSSQAARSGLIIRHAELRPLLRLITALRDDPRVQEHSGRVLQPLIDYDRTRSGDLIAVLTAVLAHPTNRTAAASASHLSRSVFYQRLTLIADLLDADLEDGETLASLQVALLAR